MRSLLDGRLPPFATVSSVNVNERHAAIQTSPDTLSGPPCPISLFNNPPPCSPAACHPPQPRNRGHPFSFPSTFFFPSTTTATATFCRALRPSTAPSPHVRGGGASITQERESQATSQGGVVDSSGARHQPSRTQVEGSSPRAVATGSGRHSRRQDGAVT